MAGRLLALSSRLSSKRLALPFSAASYHQETHQESYATTLKAVIGNRDIVGYGINGEPNYVDRVDIPMPAIRWKENTPDILTLREKEKGDWKKLSLEEKKALYRASFCQTFAELNAPTGEWKQTIGGVFFLAGCGIWLYIFMKLFVYSPIPDSFSDENQRAQLRRMIDLHVNPIEGISSQWDYEKDSWKK